jgi:hypothetical protein
MEDIVARALNVVKSNPEWINCIKNFNEPNGFMLSATPLVQEIKNAIDEENSLHSGSSIALCLQQCREILNQQPEMQPEMPTKTYRIFH